jgi:hypothetical protein
MQEHLICGFIVDCRFAVHRWICTDPCIDTSKYELDYIPLYLKLCFIAICKINTASTRILLDEELCMSNNDIFCHLRFSQTDTHLDRF